MAVRMKDIAEDLGVSVTTVSKVLRNIPDISEETRERVLTRVRELNYQPNWVARSLVTRRTHTIGLVIPDIQHPFFAQIARGLGQCLRPRGYHLLVSSSDEDPYVEEQEIEFLLARQVDALVVASAQPSDEIRTFAALSERGVNYVLIDRMFPRLKANYVGVDDTDVGRIATGHLIEQGCQRPAHIRGPETSPGVGRVEGYHQALERHKIRARPEHVVLGRTSDAGADRSGYEAMKKLLDTSPRPDGVFCFNDVVAVGAMRAILDAGLRIPQDIAVIGAGNNRHMDFLRVALSSVDQNCSRIAERTGDLLLHIFKSKHAVRPKTRLVEPSLIVRASSDRSHKR